MAILHGNLVLVSMKMLLLTILKIMLGLRFINT